MNELYAKSYLDDLKIICDLIPIAKVNTIISVLIDAYQNENNIFIMGNGGSAAAASHFTSDLIKGCSYGKEKRFKAICLNDNISTVLAYANDVSFNDIFIEQLKNFIKSDDIVIGISGSGNSKNVIKCIEYANTKNAVTIGISYLN